MEDVVVVEDVVLEEAVVGTPQLTMIVIAAVLAVPTPP
jgi:hypothetical protein